MRSIHSWGAPAAPANALAVTILSRISCLHRPRENVKIILPFNRFYQCALVRHGRIWAHHAADLCPSSSTTGASFSFIARHSVCSAVGVDSG